MTREPVRLEDYRSSRAQGVSVKEAAQYVGVSISYMNSLRSVGGGPVFSKLGRRIVYQLKDLDSWIERNRHNSTSEYDGGAVA